MTLSIGSFNGGTNWGANSPSTDDIDAQASQMSAKDALTTLKQYKSTLDRADGDWDNTIQMKSMESTFEDSSAPPKLREAIDKILGDKGLKELLDSVDDPMSLMKGQGDGQFDTGNIDKLLSHMDTSS